MLPWLPPESADEPLPHYAARMVEAIAAGTAGWLVGVSFGVSFGGVVAQDIRGGLCGTVTPAAALPQVLAIRSSITPADAFSTSTDAAGAFQLGALPSGTYRVEFSPTTTTTPANQSSYKQVTRTGIVAINDQLTDIGSTPLQ
ncbi:hypothetical protein J7E24_13390 [Hymenobacter sp. ISL-91]|uniref:MSCRAMM family adhesin SdrC n=1 Tax=Hymenobacter sp. ISL-91 TaxID=2819151 RepID=UPI001BE77F7A|nr:MSCRAMM family adhesin SdrC [Hymenobacter sp. ISL-91]MBT2558785.1 hypothetical protein [Hymenobacter sp. ISL-91]